MKTKFYLFLTLLTTVFISCSSDDDNSDNSNQEQFTLEYYFEGSYSSTGQLTFSSYTNNNLVDEVDYEDFPQDEFTESTELTVNNSQMISARITLNDQNMSFRGDATIRIINSEGEVVAFVEDEYMNTDTPQITCVLTLEYNTETGESTWVLN